MARFFLGFLVATVLYGAAAAVLAAKGQLSFGAAPEPVVVAAAEEPEAVDADPKKPKKKRPAKSRTAPSGSATTGDDLDWDGDRQVDMAGGEAQLSGSQIEAGFDSAIAKIRRCLVLVDSDGEITGKLIFGMKVGSDGVPRAVNLSGPAVVTTGDSGDCLRKAAQGIRFAKFSGPDTLFKYPITLQ
ncbi:MAG TPA: hypothetical protein VFX59_21980 [Polyangiales bacterium]|nr:hypothetical protein [Polyangiales bacterium]